jgi:hypothetical protein
MAYQQPRLTFVSQMRVVNDVTGPIWANVSGMLVNHAQQQQQQQ